MSVTNTPTTREARPARRSPATRPARVPPLPTATHTSAGSGSCPAPHLLRELETGRNEAQGAQGGGSAGGDEKGPLAAQRRRCERGRAAQRGGGNARAEDEVGTVGRVQQQRAPDGVGDGLRHQDQGGREPRLPPEDGRGEPVVGAQPARRDEPARAAGEGGADDEFELPGLVAAVRGARAVVPLDVEPAFGSAVEGEDLDRRGERGEGPPRAALAQGGEGSEQRGLGFGHAPLIAHSRID